MRLLGRALLSAAALLLAAGQGRPCWADDVTCDFYIAAAPYTIATPGHYCLSDNLIFSAASGDAVTIAANFVVLDLKGYRIAGQAAGAGTQAFGVHVTNHRNVIIRNGTIRRFHTGIGFDNGTENNNNVVERIYADSNTRYAIRFATNNGPEGVNNTVRDCIVGSTGGTTLSSAFVIGIWMASWQSFITNNTVTGTIPPTTPAPYYGILGGPHGYAVGNQVIGDGQTSNPHNVCFAFNTGSIYKDNIASRCATSYVSGTAVGTTNFP